MQREHRGARGNCSGTVDNLLIDGMVCEDAQRGKRNLSMAWIDVAKAYDSVDHDWLFEMFTLHRFPIWFAKVMVSKDILTEAINHLVQPTVRSCKGSGVQSVPYALPVLTYLMWTQTWPIANIQQLDREGRKIIVENGGNHPKGSTAILYMCRKLCGRGLKSVENEYKNTKIKAAVKHYCNADPTMAAVRSFEELAGRHSIIKDAKKYAAELDLQFWLNFPKPVAVADGKEVQAKKVKQAMYKARQQELQSTVSEER